ncbi:GAF domain-containing protein [Nocardioides sp. SR21]|uniref:GAF domain-containing protein n=1 Tax=Nocardioides sp. SR21 TaxID=2919501 RepID=UPI001FAAE39A|nr:GAF domain-containing protein [Nocardioides sp. SR21]
MTIAPLGRSLAKLRSHGLHAPTREDVRRALGLGATEDVEVLWDRVCADAEVSAHEPVLDLDELDRITRALVDMGGRPALVGRAQAVRVASYREIAARGSDAPAPGWDWARAAMDTLLKGRTPRRERLDELVSLDPFAAELRVELNQAAARIAQRLGTAIGGVSIVLDGAQCYVGRYGGDHSWSADAGGTPIEWSYCATSVRTRAPYVVPDAAADVLHRINPTAARDGVRAYAGAPLITSSGEVLGNCCVIDVVPRDFTEADIAVLQEEAAAVVADLERRRAECERA